MSTVSDFLSQEQQKAIREYQSKFRKIQDSMDREMEDALKKVNPEWKPMEVDCYDP